MLNKSIVTILLLLFTVFSFSQGKYTLPKGDYTRVNFELVNNLIVFPVDVNGYQLSFILDSGVSKPILFNIINFQDTLQMNNVESIYLRGLGDGGYLEALKSKKNKVKIGDAINLNQDIFVIFDETINFTPRLGIVVHGIIGYDIFKDFIVEINYVSKFIKLYNPKSYKYKKCKKCQIFDLEFDQNKPYINALVEYDSLNIPVKLLIDTGGSDALWLFEEESLGIFPNQNAYFKDFLGKGLSGSVYGKRSTVSSFSLNKFYLKNVNVAYPDSSAISSARHFKERNGSIAGELLKRFNMIIDYNSSLVTLKKNSNFKKPFYYNKSGITLEQKGVRIIKEKSDFINTDSYGNKLNGSKTISVSETYNFLLIPAFEIVELRENSVADKAGIKIGDIILKINGKEVDFLKLYEVNQLLGKDEGNLIRLKIDRQGKELNFSFRLENLF